jgi:hypothetical protein
MNLLRCMLLLLLTTAWSQGQPASQGQPPSLPDEPVAFVTSLYRQVVARHPLGIPQGADWKIFGPYLSKALKHRIDVSGACESDWFRQHPEHNLKGPFGGLWESGIFSGPDEQAEPRAFHIERTQLEKDGGFRVYVKLTWETPPQGPWIWYVAVVGVEENGHLAVDDVIYLKDPEHRGPDDADVPLSEVLSEGCDGPHWVGFGDQQTDSK